MKCGHKAFKGPHGEDPRCHLCIALKEEKDKELNKCLGISG